MCGPWLGVISVRRMERGQVPVVDFLCTACMHHRRVTGRAARCAAALTYALASH